MTEAALPADDDVGSSHDADVDAGYDEADPAADTAAASPDGLDGQEDSSHAADVDAGFDDR